MTALLDGPGEATKELLTDIVKQINDLRQQAHCDLARYREEYDCRIKDRRERLYYETRDLERTRDAIIKELALIESLKPRTIIVSREVMP